MTRPLRIGLGTMNFSAPGYGGGLDIYARQLAEALAEYDLSNEYTLFLYEYGLAGWSHRPWPNHVRLVTLSQTPPRPSRLGRLQTRLNRWAGRASAAPSPDDYLAQQLEAQDLDLIHYPGTTIAPLELKTRCVLTFFDLQHEYYPEYFSKAELERRWGSATAILR